MEARAADIASLCCYNWVAFSLSGNKGWPSAAGGLREYPSQNQAELNAWAFRYFKLEAEAGDGRPRAFSFKKKAFTPSSAWLYKKMEEKTFPYLRIEASGRIVYG